MSTITGIRAALAATVVSLAAAMAGPANAAGDTPHIDHQKWSFGGFGGHFDRAQLQRGFQVYKEVCANCHGVKRLNFRNLAQPGGPQFAEGGVKSLAATYKVDDGPNDDGKMFQRPGKPSDAIPGPFKNDQEARSAQNGALPPDLSLITKARGAVNEAPFYLTPFVWIKDIVSGYQEGGADYVFAILTGYEKAPANMQLADGMSYNKAFPGHQIAMAEPLSDGLIKYEDGTKGTIEQYARDVTAFLHWAGDPSLEDRKRMGRMVMLYLLVTSILLYLAKKRVWAKAH